MSPILSQSANAGRCVLLTASLSFFGCGGDVVAGEADPEQETDPDESNGCAGCAGNDWQASGECADKDALTRASYENWRHSPNKVSGLPPGTWQGWAVSTGFLITLTIHADQSITLQAGEPAPPPEKDKGYLRCHESDPLCDWGLVTGGTYAIHGAVFEKGELRFPFVSGGAYETWCAQQTSYPYTDNCDFLASPNESAENGSTCYLGEEVVDCDWLYQIPYLLTCSCTSDSCFPTISVVGDPTVELSYSSSSQSLSGRILRGRVGVTGSVWDYAADIELSRMD